MVQEEPIVQMWAVRLAVLGFGRKILKKQSERVQYGLKVEEIHTHIGSGSDPEVWKTVASMSLDIVKRFPSAQSLNLGQRLQSCPHA